MRKAINTAAIIFFIWLLFDALNVMSALLNFVLAGEVPVFKIILDPSTMLAIYAAIALLFVFEHAAKRVEPIRRLRENTLVNFSALLSRAARNAKRA